MALLYTPLALICVLKNKTEYIYVRPLIMSHWILPELFSFAPSVMNWICIHPDIRLRWNSFLVVVQNQLCFIIWPLICDIFSYIWNIHNLELILYLHLFIFVFSSHFSWRDQTITNISAPPSWCQYFLCSSLYLLFVFSF